MELDCRISADGATIDCNPAGLSAASSTDPDRVSRIPYPTAVARAILDALDEPNRMIEHIPAPRAGVFRVTWKPILMIEGMTTETDIALISARDYQHGRMVMCTVDADGWFELVEWAQTMIALDPIAMPDGLGLDLLRAVANRGGGSTSVKASQLYRAVDGDSQAVIVELRVLCEQGFLRSFDQSPPAYALTRKGAEALLAIDE